MQRALAGCEQLSPLALPHSSKWRGLRRLPRPLGCCWQCATFSQFAKGVCIYSTARCNSEPGRWADRRADGRLVGLAECMTVRRTAWGGTIYHELASTSLHRRRRLTDSVRHARTQQQTRRGNVMCSRESSALVAFRHQKRSTKREGV